MARESREFSRQLRVSREMHKGIANILHNAIQDPRISTLITVSDVEVSRDLSYARIYFSILKNDVLKNKDKKENNIKDIIKTLQRASGYIRFLLGRVMRLRITPKLVFFYDNSLIEGIRISHLIGIYRNIKKEKDAKRIL